MSIYTFLAPGGVELSYRYDDFTEPWKDAPTLVLLHGFPENSKMWFAWVPLLGRHFRIVRPDRRGLALSTVGEDEFEESMDSMVMDCIGLLDHLELDKSVWIGQASGGIVALHLAARAPQRVQAVVTIGTPVHSSQPYMQGIMGPNLRPGEALYGAAGLQFMLTMGMRQWAQICVRERPDLKDGPEELRNWVMEEYAQHDPKVASKVYRTMGGVDCTDMLKDVKVPVLVLTADKENPVSPEQMEKFKSIPDVRFATVTGKGSHVNYTNPEQCVREAAKFLRELGLFPQ